MTDNLSPTPLEAVTAPPSTLMEAFKTSYPGHEPELLVRAPGRVNLLGGHVDMQDGLVINIGINRELWLAVRPSQSDLVQLCAPDLSARTALLLSKLETRADMVGNALAPWAHYPAGVAWALGQRGVAVQGIDAAFMGSVLMRAGLSSSAAVETVFAVAWQKLGGWALPPRELALACCDAERGYIGVGIGIQDQFTVLHARRGHAICLDCRSLDHDHVPFPEDAQIVVCDTLTRRELSGSNYNSRSGDAKKALALIREDDPAVTALRDVDHARLRAYEPRLTADQFRRARHVVTEIARVREGDAALRAGDIPAFGALMNASYRSARDDYGSSSDALDAMWEAATSHPACYGARYSGGGEAGAVVALVDADGVDVFAAHAGKTYQRLTGSQSHIFPVLPVDGAGVMD